MLDKRCGLVLGALSLLREVVLKLCESLFVATGIKYLAGDVGWAKGALMGLAGGSGPGLLAGAGS